MDFCSVWIKDSVGIDVIFLDYSKAFDSVPHHRLISKLEAFGVHGNLSLWLSNFLSNCFQRVVLNGHLSSWAQVVSGVPQGSVLGPLLFILYVNDIPDLIESNVRMFADDTKFILLFRALTITLGCKVMLTDCCSGLTHGCFGSI